MRPVQPLKRKTYTAEELDKKSFNKLAGFDIETDGLGGTFIQGGIYFEDTEEYQTFLSMKDIMLFMFNHPDYVYLAHNAKGYEFSYLVPLLLEDFVRYDTAEHKMIMRGEGDVIGLHLRRKRAHGKRVLVQLYDTLPLFDQDLKKTAKNYCPHLPKGDIDFEKETFTPDNPVHQEYLKRDCMIPVFAYRALEKQVRENFGTPLGLTAPSTGMKALQATLSEEDIIWPLNPRKETYVRSSYHGAVNHPGKICGITEDVTSVDFNGHYGWASKQELPYGPCGWTTTYKSGKLGIYTVRVQVPFSEHIGILPFQTKQGTIYPSTGSTFTTTITSYEYEEAKKIGYGLEVLGGLYWLGKKKFLEPFINKVEQLELLENGKYKPVAKIMRNGPYGKLGQQPLMKKALFLRGPQKGVKPFLDEKNHEIPYLFYTYEEHRSSSMHVEWATFITAYARMRTILLARRAYELGATTAYVDTDCLKTNHVVIDKLIAEGTIEVGKTYGTVKYEVKHQPLLVIAPKVYHHVSEQRMKGITRRKVTDQLYYDALNKKFYPISWQSVNKPLTVLKNGGIIKAKVERSVSNPMECKSFDYRDGYFYNPIVCNDERIAL